MINRKRYNYLLDLDGTVYRGMQPIPFAGEFIDHLNRNGRKFLMVTNCPLHAPSALVHKLKGMDITVKEENILTSGQVTAAYVSRNRLASRVYVVGSDALKAEFENRGILVVEENPDCVVVGYDRDFNYAKMTRATQYILGGAKFVSTNSDASIPEGDTYIPHTGAISLSIEAATGVKPLVMGKPERFILDEALHRLECSKEDCCMVGDRLDTDILAGINYGMESFLVLTGVTDKQGLQKSHIRPSVVFDDLKCILQYENSIN